MAVDSERYAYATLVTTDEYAIGAEVLLQSLKEFSSNAAIHRVVLITPNVSTSARARLQRVGCEVLEVMPLSMASCPSASDHVSGWAEVGYTKLRIWGLVQYTKIFYIDADCLVVGAVEDVFKRDVDFAAAPDVFPPDKFNAGVLLVKPNEAIFQDMMRKIPELPSYDGGDTGFLNAYFPNWFTYAAEARLPFGYNAQRTMYWMTHEKAPAYWNEAVKPLKIIHFCSSPKPWEGKKKGDLEMLWWAKFVTAQSSDLDLF
ncbi:Glycosyltransferase, family GT8 [Tribonema minus]|uniref:Glycosyltransferase, family GT8 n=1 Tax=Tribonema minus TaxID=303371 RepID=A0A835YMF4_9STRA|nr:Glycosyltransferase, family GT8 [Tribonema minus]